MGGEVHVQELDGASDLFAMYSWNIQGKSLEDAFQVLDGFEIEGDLMFLQESRI
mgnify:CR=1 FL=1